MKKQHIIPDWEKNCTYPDLNINFDKNLQRRTKRSKGIDGTAYTDFNA